jgi:hypothetical protein
MTGSRPGRRTTGRSAALTSTSASFDGATPNGQPVSWSSSRQPRFRQLTSICPTRAEPCNARKASPDEPRDRRTRSSNLQPRPPPQALGCFRRYRLSGSVPLAVWLPAMAVTDRRPRRGVDYSRHWHELLAWFPDDAACLRYLERLTGVEASRVGSVVPSRVAGGGWAMGCAAARCGDRRLRSRLARSSPARALRW